MSPVQFRSEPCWLLFYFILPDIKHAYDSINPIMDGSGILLRPLALAIYLYTDCALNDAAAIFFSVSIHRSRCTTRLSFNGRRSNSPEKPRVVVDCYDAHVPPRQNSSHRAAGGLHPAVRGTSCAPTLSSDKRLKPTPHPYIT
jgi:hypothetical protein